MEEDIKDLELKEGTNKRTKSQRRRHLRHQYDEKCRRRRHEIYCLLCQDYGHAITDDCAINATCFSCGIKGHVRRDCPETADDELTTNAEILSLTSTLPSSIPLSVALMPKDSNYNFIFIEIETIQASNSSHKQLTQIGCHYLKDENSFFTAIKPKELNHYLDDFKKNGDLLQLLNMQKNDAGDFEFRKLFEINENDAPLCVEEYEALLALNVFLGDNCILFSLQETNIQLVLKRMNHFGLNTDSIEGFCTWQGFLTKIGEKEAFEFDDWYKEKSNKAVPQNLNAGIVAKMVQETVNENQDLDLDTVLIDASKTIQSILAEIANNIEIEDSDKPLEYLECCSSFRPAMPIMITMHRLETLDVSDDEDDVCQKSEITILDDDEDSKEFQSILACHSVRVGSYKVCSSANMQLQGGDFGSTYLEKSVYVVITQKGVQINVPQIMDDEKLVAILIPMADIVQVLAHFGMSMPVLFIDICPDACEKVRNNLNMKDNQPFFFDVTSEAETLKRITILPEKLTNTRKYKIRKNFGAKFRYITFMEANEILVSCTPSWLKEWSKVPPKEGQLSGEEVLKFGVNSRYEQIRCEPCNRTFKCPEALSQHYHNSAYHKEQRDREQRRSRSCDQDGERLKRRSCSRDQDRDKQKRRSRSRDQDGDRQQRRSRSCDQDGDRQKRRSRSRDQDGDRQLRRSRRRDQDGYRQQRRSRSRDQDGDRQQRRSRSRDQDGDRLQRRSRSRDQDGGSQQRRSRSRDQDGDRQHRRSRSRDQDGDSHQRRSRSHDQDDPEYDHDPEWDRKRRGRRVREIEDDTRIPESMWRMHNGNDPQDEQVWCIPCDRIFNNFMSFSMHCKNSAKHKGPQIRNDQTFMTSKVTTSIEIVLELEHTSILKDKPVVLKSGVVHTHDWHLLVKAAEGGNCECYLEKVVFVTDYPLFVSRPPFEIKESGFKSSSVPIDLYFKSQDKHFRKWRVNYKLILQPNKQVVPPTNPAYQQELKMCHKETITIHGAVGEDFKKRLMEGGGKLLDTTVPLTTGVSRSTFTSGSVLLPKKDFDLGKRGRDTSGSVFLPEKDFDLGKRGRDYHDDEPQSKMRRVSSSNSMTSKVTSPIEIVLELEHTAVLRDQPVVLKSGVTHTHNWHLLIKAADGGNCECYLEKVVFVLHNTFDNPMRNVSRPPFEIKETGYCSFTLPIDLYFKTQDKHFRKTRVNYELILQPNKQVVPSTDPAYQQQLKMCRKETITIPATVDEGFKKRLMEGGGKLVIVPPIMGASSSMYTSVDRSRL